MHMTKRLKERGLSNAYPLNDGRTLLLNGLKYTV